MRPLALLTAVTAMLLGANRPGWGRPPARAFAWAPASHVRAFTLPIAATARAVGWRASGGWAAERAPSLARSPALSRVLTLPAPERVTPALNWPALERAERLARTVVAPEVRLPASRWVYGWSASPSLSWTSIGATLRIDTDLMPRPR